MSIATAASQIRRLAAGTELRRNVLETYGNRVLVVAISFATAVIVSRALGPAGRGLFAVATAIGAIGVQFGNIGLHLSNTYFVARDRSLLPALMGNTLAAILVAGAATVLVGMSLMFWPKLAPIHGGLLVLALASVPAGLGYLFSQGLLLGVNEVRAYNAIECVGKFLGLVLVSLALLLRVGSVELLFGITVFTVVLSFLWGLWRLRRASPEPPAVSMPIFRQSLPIGVKGYLILFFGFLVLRVDLVMVKYMLGATQAGYYSISQVISENAMMFPTILGMLLFPKLSSIKVPAEKLQLANKAMWVTAALMLPVVGIAALAAKPLIVITFGRSFLPAVKPFVWLMPGIYFLGIETVMVQLLNSEGFPPSIVAGWIVSAVINITSNFWVIPHYGITGASISSSVCYFLMFLIVSFVVWKRGYARKPEPAIADRLPSMLRADTERIRG